jgi:farnesyl-diphosphate farnesyltransferase
LRIADTLEDAIHWPSTARSDALDALGALLETPSWHEAHRLASAWRLAVPCDHPGYLELLGALPAILGEIGSFAAPRRRSILHHAQRVIKGMASFIRSGREGELIITGEAELQRYCYVVAGIVGELLTDLFLDVAPRLEAVEDLLRAHAGAFGEGLQLVNILKDAAFDLRDHRTFIPSSIGPQGILELARSDLARAGIYIDALQRAGAPRGIVAFCAFPVLLARATLDALDRVGTGAKLSRGAVMQLLDEMNAALDRGTSALVVGARS